MNSTLSTQHIPAAQKTYQALLEDIIKLRLEPGQSVSEKEISTQIGVSRQPVREAFIRLSQEGLLNIRPQIGTYVSRLNVAQINEAGFARVALECAAVREASGKASDEDFQNLDEIITSHRKANKQEKFDLVYERDTAFHIKIFEISGYPGLWKMVSQARAHMARLRSLSVANMTYSVTRSVDYHAEILTEMQARRADEAAAKMKAHVESNLSYMAQLIEEMPNYFET